MTSVILSLLPLIVYAMVVLTVTLSNSKVRRVSSEIEKAHSQSIERLRSSGVIRLEFEDRLLQQAEFLLNLSRTLPQDANPCIVSDRLQASPTIVRRLTAAASSAIAAIAIDGPQALDVVSPALVTASGKPIRLGQACARFAHWRFSDPLLADEHVMVLVRGPHAIEIHCHGGLAITGRIMEQLQAVGCEGVGRERSDSSQLPVDSERSTKDLDDFVTDSAIQAAAREALQNALTLKASLVWLEQYQGALARDFATLRQLMQEDKRCDAQEFMRCPASSSQVRHEVAAAMATDVGWSTQCWQE